MKSNVIQEVSDFLKHKKKINHPLHKSIGLEILEKYIDGIYSFDDALDLYSKETRRYAKRQITWFKNKARNASIMNFEEAKHYLIKNI